MEFKILDYHVAKRLDALERADAFLHLTKDWRDLPEHLGLKCIDSSRFWFKDDIRECLLVIADKKQWMLARLKYGI